MKTRFGQGLPFVGTKCRKHHLAAISLQIILLPYLEALLHLLALFLHPILNHLHRLFATSGSEQLKE